MPVLPYDSVEQALNLINSAPRPLALYWFDDDAARTEQVLRSTHAGGVSVNDTLMHIAQESLPFGGVGASGMGHYHGRWGFDTFSKLTPVFYQSRVNGLGLFAPPYRPWLRNAIGWMKKL
jgi:coniferyl-aldehyde dehydrogenase